MQAQVRVGQYTLERKLGEGGMAEVWEAHHIRLGSKAAIKFLLSKLAGDPDLEERFLIEGKRQAKLQHPNIVHAIDFVQQDGRSYLIMQYVDGENLETKLNQQHGPLSLQDVHAISWDVLSALDYAHSVGVVHRDVKPSNILIDKSGRVWLTDFGIALALSEEPRLTRTGTAVGTAIYMSPEQIVRPRSVDARTDIYSFGCVLYAMLCGHPPFGEGGETDFYIKDCHVRTPPPPLVYSNPSISPLLEQVVQKCLEKDPARRFQTCGAVMPALDAAIASHGNATAPAPVPPREHTIIETNMPLQAPPRQVPTPVPGPFATSAHPTAPTFNTPAFTPAPTPVQAVATTPVPVPPPPPPTPVSKHKKGRGVLIAIVLLVLAAAGVGAYMFFVVSPKPVLRLEGSTTVGDALAPAMLKAFLVNEGATDIEDVPSSGSKEHHDVRAKLKGHWRASVFSVLANGSANAFKALSADRAEIGMASRPIKPDEIALLASKGDMQSPSCEHVMALDGIAVIVNRGNQVPPLSLQQLSSMFRGQITDWSQVGARPGAIHLYGRSSDSGTFDTFDSLVLGGDKKAFSPSLKVEPDGDKIASDIASDPGGVGYVGLAQIGETTPLQLYPGPGATPLLPSQFTVSTEDYALSRRLFLYTPAHRTDLADRFVEFALSSAGQRVVKTVGYIEQTPYFEQVSIPANAPTVYRQRITGLRRMSVNFRFKPKSFDLDTKAQRDLQRVYTALSENGIQSGVEILGFADSKGSPAQNQSLSEQRAQVVADRLRAYGITVEVGGFSSAMPVGDNSTDDGREKNRRVEVWAR